MTEPIENDRKYNVAIRAIRGRLLILNSEIAAAQITGDKIGEVLLSFVSAFLQSLLKDIKSELRNKGHLT